MDENTMRTMIGLDGHILVLRNNTVPGSAAYSTGPNDAAI